MQTEEGVAGDIVVLTVTGELVTVFDTHDTEAAALASFSSAPM